MKRARPKLGLLLVLGMLTAVLPVGALTPAVAVDLHISEFHYDNDGGDVGEFVEVTGDAGFDLTGWSIVPYNGSNGTQYSVTTLSGAIDEEGTGIGAVSFPISGLQNGAPDGIALVDSTGTVVEFLSYEGDFTATDGPANGMTSTDVGVSEPGDTPVGQSLQLLSGVWTGPAEASEGRVNGTPPPPVVNITEFHYDNASTDVGEFIEVTGTAGADLTGWSFELYNGNGGALYDTIALTGTIDDEGAGLGAVSFATPGLQNGGPDGMALINNLGVVVEFLSYEGSFDAVGGTADGMTSVDVGVTESSSTPAGESLQFFNGIWTGPLAESPGVINTGPPPPPADAVITEFHYDNASTDVGEFVEVTGTAGASLDGWTLELYNGNDGAVYNTIGLFGFIDDEGTGIGAVDVQLPTNGLQNGAPDGIALVDDTGTLVEFLSYEGVFIGVGGAADGVESVDVEVMEDSSTAVGESLQLIGGVWTGPALASPGDVNAAPPPPPADAFITEFHYDNDGTDVGEFVEVTGTAGGDLTGWSVVFYNGNGGASYGTLNLTGLIDDENGSQGAVAFEFSGIQNGPPDGLALVDPDGAVVEFLSYEGVFTATDGPAVGLDSIDVGVSEGTSTLVGESLQLIGSEWVGPVAETRGLLNPAPPAEPTPIYVVQGNGLASPLDGQVVLIEGVVTADHQEGDFNGFFMQEVVGDADVTTSDGIFVFEGGNTVDVNVGDVVRVEGTVDEFFDLTEITDVTSVSIVGTAPVTPTVVSLPWATLEEPEQYEGMYITIPQSLVISEYFNFDRFGEIVLTTDRAMQPTAVFDPGSPEAAALAEANQLARITLDDNRTGQNPDPALHPNGQPFTLDNMFRGGDTVANVTGVINYSFGLYRIQPTQGADYTAANPRPAAPDGVGGTLTVASFNVLNYFTTFGSRGADDAEEFERQRTKIIAAIAEIDADIVGLMEIENNEAAIIDLVNGLNDLLGAGTYDYVDTGVIGPDAIKVAFIYKPATVGLNGDYKVLDSLEFLDPNNLGSDKNRPALAQTFTELANGESVTVVVNHLKSKGSSCGEGDDDPDAGSCNLTRTLAAQILADWLADPANGFDEDVLIIGDLNSYDKEDPIDTLIAAGYSDLIFDYLGENAYSYVFSGQWGYLDYAMANGSLQSKVTGTTIWHINADEPDLIDYDTTFKQDAQDALYEPNAYRASDHDPVIVGLDMTPPDTVAPVVEAEFDTIYAGRSAGLYKVDFACTDDVDPDPDCVADINGIAVNDGQRVFLIKSWWGQPWHRQIGSILFIKDTSFTLTVVGTDEAGNSDTATAEPTFRRSRRHCTAEYKPATRIDVGGSFRTRPLLRSWLLDSCDPQLDDIFEQSNRYGSLAEQRIVKPGQVEPLAELLFCHVAEAKDLEHADQIGGSLSRPDDVAVHLSLGLTTIKAKTQHVVDRVVAAPACPMDPCVDDHAGSP